ncbi:unnamed protein product [Closterium sp. NIES-54]
MSHGFKIRPTERSALPCPYFFSPVLRPERNPALQPVRCAALPLGPRAALPCSRARLCSPRSPLQPKLAPAAVLAPAARARPCSRCLRHAPCPASAPRALPCLHHAPCPACATHPALPVRHAPCPACATRQCPALRTLAPCPGRASALPAPAPCTVRATTALHAAQPCHALPGCRQSCPTRCPALTCPASSRCLCAPALPRAYRQLPLPPAHAPTVATATAPTTAATAPTVPATATAVATLNLAPLLLPDTAYHGQYHCHTSAAANSVRWGATTGGTCESTLAGSVASRRGASAGAEPEEALHTFTLDSGASRCFFCDSTTVTPLTTPVPVTLADPSGGPVVARGATVLPCPAAPFGLLTGLHLPSFAKNFVATSVLQDQWVTVTQPRGELVAICTDSRIGEHLATFTRRPGSGLYTLTTESAVVAESGQVAASVEVSASCLCRLLTHQTLLWHHSLGQPSLPRLRGMHSRLLVSGLPRSLPPLPRSLALPCLPCVEGRQRAAPHPSLFPPTTAPLQTLHMDVWGPARVTGQDGEGYFLLVVDDYTRYTTVFPLQSKADVRFLIRWIRAVRLQLRARFREDLPVLRLHSVRGGEFCSRLLEDFCGAKGIVQSYMLSASPQQNGIAERRIGLVMELNLCPRVSHPETFPTLRWTGEVGDASAFRVWGSLSLVHDLPTGKLSPRTLRCVFLGSPTVAPPWQFYHPGSRRVLSSRDVTFDEFVCFYCLHPHCSSPVPLLPLSLVNDPAPSSPPPSSRSHSLGCVSARATPLG